MADGEIKIKIDGETVCGKKGQTVLEAGLDNGVLIPHYCWHPALSVSGNCRMCIVNMKGSPKPIIACQTTIAEGMEIDAFSESAKKNREGVMEFLLINHPLDCPVCDQAGECDLQEYSYEFGKGTSRFEEAKNQKPNKDLGPLVRFYGNRCIVCTRCVRFCEEISGTSELSTRERGDRNYIDTFPGFPLENPLSLCTTDICPVGALLDRDFIHKARVWNLSSTKTTCGGCATGCNVNAQTWNDTLQRVVPRENQAVNRWWMCDEGRLLYHATDAKDRIRNASELGKGGVRTNIGFDRALDLLAENWRGAREVHGRDGVGLVISGAHTCEELYVALGLLKGTKDAKDPVSLGAEGLPLATVHAPLGFSWQAKDKFQIAADKNPNREGVRQIFGEAWTKGVHAGFEGLVERIESKRLKVLVILDGLVEGGLQLPETILKVLDKVPYLVVFESHSGSGLFRDKAHLRLPAATFFEKDGTFINGNGRLQRARPAVSSGGALRWEFEVLQDLGRKLELWPRVLSAASVCKRLAAALNSEGKDAKNPFAGLDYNALGDFGVGLPERDMADGRPADGRPAEKANTGYEAGPVSRGRYLDQAAPEMIRVSVHRGG